MSEINSNLYDDYRGRLGPLLPVALCIWLPLLWGFGEALRRPLPPVFALDAIEIRLADFVLPIEASLPGATTDKPREISTIRAALLREGAEEASGTVAVPPSSPAVNDDPVASHQTTSLPGQAPAWVPVTGIPHATAPSKASADALSQGRMGARAIYHPMPDIPEELREEAINALAVVRFYVAPDGAVTADLVKATFSPLLNRVILETMRSWRFFPAIVDGKAVASVQDVRIRLEVK